MIDALALGAIAGRARELRRQLELTRGELRAGRLAAASTLLDRSIRELDAALAEAKRAGLA